MIRSRTPLLAILALAATTSVALSAPRSKVRGYDPACNVTMPCVGAPMPWEVAQRPVRLSRAAARAEALERRNLPFGTPLRAPETARSYLAGAPSFVRGRLICAINVGRALEARGIAGTGTARARDYLRWGVASGPKPGAVAVFSRRGGGHVAIVDHVQADGTVIYMNPSSRHQAWQVGPYNRRPIAFRSAS